MGPHPASGSLSARSLRRFTVAAVLSLSLVPAVLQADSVLTWNQIAANAAVQANQNPFVQARTAAVVQLAVFTAVNAVTGEHAPYVATVTAPPGASIDAAVATAAHRVLVTYLAGNLAVVASLDTQLTASLAAVMPGPAKDDGIQVGEAAAEAILALRENDGSSPPQFYVVPAAAPPGAWLATPGCPSFNGVPAGAFFHWRNVAPFGITSVVSFLPPPPPLLTSNEFAKAFNEVKTVGSLTSTEAERPPDRQAVVKLFAAASPSYLFSMVARQVAAAEGRSASDNARSLALITMAISDALVASFHAKYHYAFWRPETAIRAGDTDGNDHTLADTDFKPYIGTPCFPSYPSNHASGSSAGLEMLRRLYGAAGYPVELSHPAVAGVTLHYSQLLDILGDVSDARVYGGIHFRFDQEAGDRMGREIATSVYKNNLRPVRKD